MRSSTISVLASLLALSSASSPSLTDVVALQARAAPGGVMRPINPLDFEAAVSGIQRRADTVDFAELDPKEQAQLVYGTARNGGQMILANMTLKAPDGQPIVMMERLEGLTSKVDCQGDDGQLSVTFNSKAAFNYAMSSWRYLNNDTDAKFLMITNHDGCGTDDQRAVYEINSVRNNATGLTTFLEATQAQWKNVTGTYTMDFGKAVIPAVKRRGLGDLFGKVTSAIVGEVTSVASDVQSVATNVVSNVESVATNVASNVESVATNVVSNVESVATEVATDVKSVATNVATKVTSVAGAVVSDAADTFKNLGDADFTKEVEFNLQAGQENSRSLIFKDPTVIPPRLQMECADCFMDGKLKAAGTLKVEDFKVTELSIGLSPEDFRTAFEIDTTVNLQKASPFNPSTKASPFKETIELLEVPVPGAGIVVPEIFTLGLVGGIDVGFEMTLKGSIGFTLGMTATLPNTANIFLDLANPENSHADGFEQATLDPIANVNNGSITLDGAIFVRPKFALEAKVEAVGELSASIGVNLPRINANVTTQFNENGACPGQSDSKTAVLFKWGPALSITAGIDGTLKGFSARVFQRTLATFNFDQHSDCFPVNLPFLDPVNGTVSTAPETTAAPAPVGTATSAPAIPTGTAANSDEPLPTFPASANLTARGYNGGSARLPRVRRSEVLF